MHYSPFRHSPPLASKKRFVRLACLSHAASVRSEPGSNSSIEESVIIGPKAVICLTIGSSTHVCMRECSSRPAQRRAVSKPIPLRESVIRPQDPNCRWSSGRRILTAVDPLFTCQRTPTVLRRAEHDNCYRDLCKPESQQFTICRLGQGTAVPQSPTKCMD